MKYLSVCSGIEAATCAWHPLGWQPFAFSEIEPFPSAVLTHHYHDVPNLGDMTKFKEWPDATIDILVGGTPCQSFSVAGLRKGLADPRGNLMLTYLAIADRYRPSWLVWENVPGVLSDKTEAFKSLLDGMESLGYIIDCDILDAQFHGVAQRRRRIFVCGQHRDSLLSQKTDSSALTIAQCWQEILHGILIEASSRLGSEPINSDLLYLSRDGVARRMRLFGLLGETNCFNSLRSNLVEAFLRYQAEQKFLDALLGERESERTQEGRLMGSQADGPYTLTEQSLSSALEESYAVMKSFITSTETNSITPAQIYSCSIAVLLIARLIQRLSQSSPPFWSAASSSLIAVEEFTNYARSTSSDLFGDLERVQAWRDFVEQAERTSDAIADIGIECFGKILSVSHSLQGNPPPSRKAGQGVAGSLAASTGGCDENDARDGRLITPVCMSTGQAGAGIGIGTTLNCNHEAPIVTHSLRAEGFDASEDGTGRGTPLVPICFMANDSGADAADNVAPTLRSGNQGGQMSPAIAFDCKASGQNGFGVGEIASTMRSMGHAGSHQNGGGHQPVAFQSSQSGVRTGESHATLDSNNGSRRHNGVVSGMQVRRLTPRECERLQGFPDDYTLIPVRGKLAADGPRYKALGNSMAVPVMAWIGRRIATVEAINSAKVAA